MNEQELIAAVKAAKDKTELEALVKRELGIDIDKRTGLEKLRADILAGLGVVDDGESGAGTDTGQAPQSPESNQLSRADLETSQATVSSVQRSQGDVVDAARVLLGLQEPKLPALDDGEPLVLEEQPQNRLLRNTENGREFIWTPELAKLPHMEEV